MSSFTINPTAVPTGGSVQTIILTGVGTTWLTSPPVLSALAGTTSGLAVTTNTKCTFQYSPPSWDQTDTISDATSGFSIPLISSSRATLLSIVNWVQTDVLHRQDMLQPLINAAVNLYTVIIRKVPFDEFMYTSAEYNMTPRVGTYNLLGLNPPIWPPVDAISSIRLTYGPQGSTSVRLRRSSTRLYDSISYGLLPSRPSTYSRWGTSIEANPVPDSSSYTFRIRYRGRPVINATNPENTIILVDDAWDELFKWELLYRAYYMLDQAEKAMALVQPSQLPRQGSPRRQIVYEPGIIPRLWNDLLATISQKEAPDEDFGINPVVRNYSQA